MLRRDLHSVVASEPVGPYTLLRVERRPRAGRAGPVLHARSAGPRAAAADEPLAGAARRARLPLRGDRARHERPRGARAGRPHRDPRPARERLPAGRRPAAARRRGIGVAPFPYLSQTLDRPDAILGFRSSHHAEAAELVPNAEVVVEPTRVTELLEPGYDVLACGPPRCSRPCVSWRRGPSWPGRRPWPAGTAPATAASSRSAGTTSACAWRAPSLLLNASGCLDALAAPDVARSWTPSSRRPSPRSRARATSPAHRGDRPRHAQLDRPPEPGPRTVPGRGAPAAARAGHPALGLGRGFAADEYAETCARLDDVTIELNLSCPNVDEAPESAAEIVAACRASTPLPIYAKLSPAQPDMGEAARAVEAAGADGLSLVNTIRGLELDPATLRPRLGRGVGGYSGPALKPVASPPSMPHSAQPSCPSSAWEASAAVATRPSFSRPAQAGLPSEPRSSPTPARRFGSGESWPRRPRPWAPPVRRTCAESPTNPTSTPCRQH